MNKNVFAKKDKRTELEKERDELIELLRKTSPELDAYAEHLSVIERLDKLIAEEEKRRPHASPDTIITAIAGSVQVGAILFREQFHNVTSKALGFVLKGRVR